MVVILVKGAELLVRADVILSTRNRIQNGIVLLGDGTRLQI